MNKARTIVSIGAMALSFGCTAGVQPTPIDGGGGTGPGVGGTTGTGGATGTGGTSGSTGFDGSIDLSVADRPGDGVCSATTTAAEPVPLDLYVLMDSSKSMLDPTSAGPSKWDAMKTALNTFFNDSASAGLGIALKYFPQVQNVMDMCAADNDCGTYGPCELRLACIKSNTYSIVDTSVMLCPTPTTACTNTMEMCQRIQNCGGQPCVAGPTAAAGACGANCSNFPGYCQKRDICTPATYATPDVPIGTLPGAAGALMTSLTGKTPSGFTPTGPALTGRSCSRASASPPCRRTGWRSCS